MKKEAFILGDKLGDKLKENKSYYLIFLRYLIILLFGLGNLFLFYKLFTPLTIYPVYYILKLFYIVGIQGTSIYIGATGFVNSTHILEIIPACVAGSAYYLLFILNMATEMSARKRIYSLIYSFAVLLALNIVRIVIIAVLFVNDSAYFDITHKIFWYSLSIVFVVLIWFSEVKFFKKKNIPVYSDFVKIRKAMKTNQI